MYYGWASESWHPAYNDKKEHVGEYVLRRSEFAQYLDEEFFTAFQIWKRSSRHGLPNGPGWLNEPEAVIDLIDLFEGERDRLDREEMKTRGNN